MFSTTTRDRARPFHKPSRLSTLLPSRSSSASPPRGSLSKFPPSRAIVGLRNFGNTCYCNAPLQVLFSCQQFCHHFLSLVHARKQAHPSSPYRGRLLEAWVALLHHIYTPALSSGDGFGDRSQETGDTFADSSSDAGDRLGERLQSSRARQASRKETIRHDNSSLHSRPQGLSLSTGSRDCTDGRQCPGRLLGGDGPVSAPVEAGASQSCLKLLELMRRQHAQFAEFQQCDAHEFLRTFLDGLSAECNEAGWEQSAGVPGRAAGRGCPRLEPHAGGETLEDVRGEDPARTSERFWAANLARERSVVTDLFAGQLATIIECDRCRQRRHRFDSFLDLSLEFPANDLRGVAPSDAPPPGAGGVLLQDMLQHAFGGETSDRQAVDCPFCGVRCTAHIRRCLWRLPPEYLVLHIKRFSWDPRLEDMRRIDTRLKVTQDLDMSPYCRFSEHASVKNAVFRLEGVVSQLGTAYSGHYTALAMTGGGRWTYFSDDYVSACEFSPDPRGVYLLVFRRASNLLSGSDSTAVRRSSPPVQGFSRPHDTGKGGCASRLVHARTAQNHPGRGATGRDTRGDSCGDTSGPHRRRRSSSSLETALGVPVAEAASSKTRSPPLNAEIVRGRRWTEASERSAPEEPKDRPDGRRRETEQRELEGRKRRERRQRSEGTAEDKKGAERRELERERNEGGEQGGRLCRVSLSRSRVFQRRSEQASEAEVTVSPHSSESEERRRLPGGLRDRLTLRWRREAAAEPEKRELPRAKLETCPTFETEVGQRLAIMSRRLSESCAGRHFASEEETRSCNSEETCASEEACDRQATKGFSAASRFRSACARESHTLTVSEHAASPLLCLETETPDTGAETPHSAVAAELAASRRPRARGRDLPSRSSDEDAASASTETSSSALSSPSSSPFSSRHWLSSRGASDKFASSLLFRRKRGVPASLATAANETSCDLRASLLPAQPRPVSSPDGPVSEGAASGPVGRADSSRTQATSGRPDTPRRRFGLYSGRRWRAVRAPAESPSRCRGQETPASNPSTCGSESDEEATSSSLWSRESRKQQGPTLEGGQPLRESRGLRSRKKECSPSFSRGIQDLVNRPTLLTGMSRIARRGNSSRRSGRADCREQCGDTASFERDAATGLGDAPGSSSAGASSLALCLSSVSSSRPSTRPHNVETATAGAVCGVSRTGPKRSLSSLLRGRPRVHASSTCSSSGSSPSSLKPGTSGIGDRGERKRGERGERKRGERRDRKRGERGERKRGDSSPGTGASPEGQQVGGDASRKSRSRGPLAALRSAAAVASGAFARVKTKEEEERGRDDATRKQKSKERNEATSGGWTGVVSLGDRRVRGDAFGLGLGAGEKTDRENEERGPERRETPVEGATDTGVETPSTNDGKADPPREPSSFSLFASEGCGGVLSVQASIGAQLATPATAETPFVDAAAPPPPPSEKSAVPARIVRTAPPVSTQASLPISVPPSPPPPLLEVKSFPRRSSAASIASIGPPSACAPGTCDLRTPAGVVAPAVSAVSLQPAAFSLSRDTRSIEGQAWSRKETRREKRELCDRQQRRDSAEEGPQCRLSSVSLRSAQATSPVSPICSMPRRVSATNTSASTDGRVSASSISQDAPCGDCYAFCPAVSLSDTQAASFAPPPFVSCPSHRRAPSPRGSPFSASSLDFGRAFSTELLSRHGDAARGRAVGVSQLAVFAGRAAGETQDTPQREDIEREERQSDSTHTRERRQEKREVVLNAVDHRHGETSRSLHSTQARALWRSTPHSCDPSLAFVEKRGASTASPTDSSRSEPIASASGFGRDRRQPEDGETRDAALAGLVQARVDFGSEGEDTFVDREEARPQAVFSCSPLHQRSGCGAFVSLLALAADEAELRAEELRLEERLKALQVLGCPADFIAAGDGDRETEEDRSPNAADGLGSAFSADLGRGRSCGSACFSSANVREVEENEEASLGAVESSAAPPATEVSPRPAASGGSPPSRLAGGLEERRRRRTSGKKEEEQPTDQTPGETPAKARERRFEERRGDEGGAKKRERSAERPATARHPSVHRRNRGKLQSPRELGAALPVLEEDTEKERKETEQPLRWGEHEGEDCLGRETRTENEGENREEEPRKEETQKEDTERDKGAVGSCGGTVPCLLLEISDSGSLASWSGSRSEASKKETGELGAQRPSSGSAKEGKSEASEKRFLCVSKRCQETSAPPVGTCRTHESIQVADSVSSSEPRMSSSLSSSSTCLNVASEERVHRIALAGQKRGKETKRSALDSHQTPLLASPFPGTRRLAGVRGKEADREARRGGERTGADRRHKQPTNERGESAFFRDARADDTPETEGDAGDDEKAEDEREEEAGISESSTLVAAMQRRKGESNNLHVAAATRGRRAHPTAFRNRLFVT
ncbi:ubiquitin carboxyl-terminal hydrolase [Toxoplasma gondii TgCatPRC2]|uniref:Ubiquitin carboxyl-terminal hydrolase n=2 Tax=Toxoplasma gondii TaxID=5811 RepID=A0A151HQN1_TOXGO|nr:ubiquitin carboxyl-terminal hydrolase [Toxoplasma gondii TgCatPRC2]